MKINYTLIVLALVFSALSSTGQLVKGRVISEKGIALAGVTVKQVGKLNTIATDRNGYYTITVGKLPDTLVFSAVGYDTYKTTVTEKILKDTLLEVVLLEARAKLEDVVVVGYASERKKDIVGSTEKVSADEIAAPRMRIKDLEGRVAGISIGAPGGGKSIRLRGASSGVYTATGIITTPKQLVWQSAIQPAARKLTAGEVNDFNKWKMWEDFSQTDFKSLGQHWGLFATERYCVLLQNNQHYALPGRPVYLLNRQTGDTVWQAVTDNTGKAELWAGINREQKEDADYAIACNGCKTLNNPTKFADGINRLTLQAPCFANNTVDIAFVVDATGSMGDEIEFLKTDLEEILQKANAEYSGVDLNAATVVYRDSGDEYLTKYADFDNNLLKSLNFIKLQSANGGGDEPEAVHAALHTALDSLHWSKEARARLLFLVLDAPPHDYAKDEMFLLMKQAAAKGIRIVPVVCSGADKSTEFMMRNLALTTNGRYVFLTDDSGIGGSHIKPTTDSYTVELLANLLPRLIKQMIFVNSCENEAQQAKPDLQIPSNTLQLKVMPNPTQGAVTITSNKEVKEMFVTDFTGKILMRLHDSGRNIHLNLGDYPNGIYLVKYVTSDNEWGAEKIVLAR